MIRELQFGDLERLREIHGDKFPFPNLESGLYCSQKALLDGEKLIGAVFLKITSEAVLILDSSLGDLEKARSISSAIAELPKELEKFGLDQVHVFAFGDKFAEFLIRNFKFQRATGDPLVLTREVNG